MTQKESKLINSAGELLAYKHKPLCISVQSMAKSGLSCRIKIFALGNNVEFVDDITQHIATVLGIANNKEKGMLVRDPITVIRAFNEKMFGLVYSGYEKYTYANLISKDIAGTYFFDVYKMIVR